MAAVASRCITLQPRQVFPRLSLRRHSHCTTTKPTSTGGRKTLCFPRLCAVSEGDASNSAASSAETELEPDPILESLARKKQQLLETGDAGPIPRPLTGADAIVDVLNVYCGLLDRPFGSPQGIAAAGRVVVIRVNKELDRLMNAGQEGSENETGSPALRNTQAAFELKRVMKLVEMDMELIAAARQSETLLERLSQAKEHCQQGARLCSMF